MILSVHLLVGAAIGSKVKNYWAIFILATLSHFILDAIPHWEYTDLTANVSGDVFMTVTVKALLDILIGVSVISWFFKSSRLVQPAFWGALFALLPDGLIFTYVLAQVFFGWPLTFLVGPIAFHDKIHYTDGSDLLFWRIAAEAIVAAVALFLLWQARRAVQNKN
ncbi:hypothetical protein KKF25_01665 [Patescibacteria group bacterium]|nr:hypothetical protein [Patescibacteria group bacterium]